MSAKCICMYQPEDNPMCLAHQDEEVHEAHVPAPLVMEGDPRYVELKCMVEMMIRQGRPVDGWWDDQTQRGFNCWKFGRFLIEQAVLESGDCVTQVRHRGQPWVEIWL